MRDKYSGGWTWFNILTLSAAFASVAIAFLVAGLTFQQTQLQARSTETAEAARLDQHEARLRLDDHYYELDGRVETPLDISITNLGQGDAFLARAGWEVLEVTLPDNKPQLTSKVSEKDLSPTNSTAGSSTSIVHLPQLFKSRSQRLRGILTLSWTDGLGRSRDFRYEFTMEAICRESGTRKLTFHFVPCDSGSGRYDGSFSLMGLFTINQFS